MLTALGVTPVVLGLAGAGPAAATRSGAARQPGGAQWGSLELVLLGTKAGPPVEPLRVGISSALVVDGATYVIEAQRGYDGRVVVGRDLQRIGPSR
ncbi:hypothetical protein [Streptomyces salinarius]|uniref:Uncharacterized protein n=1 Tax=Streptomyces salinarius TaxID=2762598 RepID=A0ABW8B493_9ACTN